MRSRGVLPPSRGVPRPIVPSPEGERRSQPRPGDLPLIGWRKADWLRRCRGWRRTGLRNAPASRASIPGRDRRGVNPVAEPPGAERIRPAVRRGASERPSRDERPRKGERPSPDALPRPDERPRPGERPRKGERARNGERPRKDDRPIGADLLGGADERSAEGERLNTEPPSRDRPIHDRPNRELFRRERDRLEFRAPPAPPSPPQLPPSMDPPSTPPPRGVPNRTLAAPPPIAPAIVPVRRAPPAVNAAPSEPLWPSFRRGSRFAVARPRAPWPRRLPPRPSPLPRSDSRSRGVLPPLTCLIAPWDAPAGLRAAGVAQAARLRSPRGVPARRNAAAAAYSTNGHNTTS